MLFQIQIRLFFCKTQKGDVTPSVMLNLVWPYKKRSGGRSDAIEPPFLVPQTTFQWKFLKIIIFLSVKNILIIWGTFFTIKNLQCNGKVPWILKVLHWTIDANKQPLFLRMYFHCMEKSSLDLPSNLSFTLESQLYGFKQNESEQECQNVNFWKIYSFKCSTLSQIF